MGDVMYDVALYYRDKARQPPWFIALGLNDFILCTIHRAENTDDPGRLGGILSGLAQAPLPVVLPLHPRARKQSDLLGLKLPDTVQVVDPVGYLEMVWLESHCRLILTDSGGVQKEAYFHRKPCITLRDETEWIELVESGANVLVGADADRIASAILAARPLDAQLDLYGVGDSAQQLLCRLTQGASDTAVGR